MNNNAALYHLAKAIGHYKEVEKHLAALEELGIEILKLDDSEYVFVQKGIEKFGVPLEENGKCKSFNHLGVEVCQ